MVENDRADDRIGERLFLFGVLDRCVVVMPNPLKWKLLGTTITRGYDVTALPHPDIEVVL